MIFYLVIYDGLHKGTGLYHEHFNLPIYFNLSHEIPYLKVSKIASCDTFYAIGRTTKA